MDTQRLILFIVFSFSLLMLWENWQKHDQPVAAVSAPTQATSTGVAPVPTLGQQQVAPVSTPVASSPGLVNGPRAVVTTDVLRAEIDANGGDLRSGVGALNGRVMGSDFQPREPAEHLEHVLDGGGLLSGF